MMFVVTGGTILRVQDHIGVWMIKNGQARPALKQDIDKYKKEQKIDITV